MPTLETARRSGDVRDLEDAITEYTEDLAVQLRQVKEDERLMLSRAAARVRSVSVSSTDDDSAAASSTDEDGAAVNRNKRKINRSMRITEERERDRQAAQLAHVISKKKHQLEAAKTAPILKATQRMLEDHSHRVAPILRPLRAALREESIPEVALWTKRAVESPHERWMRRDTQAAKHWLNSAQEALYAVKEALTECSILEGNIQNIQTLESEKLSLLRERLQRYEDCLPGKIASALFGSDRKRGVSRVSVRVSSGGAAPPSNEEKDPRGSHGGRSKRKKDESVVSVSATSTDDSDYPNDPHHQSGRETIRGASASLSASKSPSRSRSQREKTKSRGEGLIFAPEKVEEESRVALEQKEKTERVVILQALIRGQSAVFTTSAAKSRSVSRSASPKMSSARRSQSVGGNSVPLTTNDARSASEGGFLFTGEMMKVAVTTKDPHLNQALGLLTVTLEYPLPEEENNDVTPDFSSSSPPKAANLQTTHISPLGQSGTVELDVELQLFKLETQERDARAELVAGAADSYSNCVNQLQIIAQKLAKMHVQFLRLTNSLEHDEANGRVSVKTAEVTMRSQTFEPMMLKNHTWKRLLLRLSAIEDGEKHVRKAEEETCLKLSPSAREMLGSPPKMPSQTPPRALEQLLSAVSPAAASTTSTAPPPRHVHFAGGSGNGRGLPNLSTTSTVNIDAASPPPSASVSALLQRLSERTPSTSSTSVAGGGESAASITPTPRPSLTPPRSGGGGTFAALLAASGSKSTAKSVSPGPPSISAPTPATTFATSAPLSSSSSSFLAAAVGSGGASSDPLTGPLGSGDVGMGETNTVSRTSSMKSNASSLPTALEQVWKSSSE